MNVVDDDAADTDFHPSAPTPKRDFPLMSLKMLVTRIACPRRNCGSVSVPGHFQPECGCPPNDLIDEQRVGADVHRRPFFLVQ